MEFRRKIPDLCISEYFIPHISDSLFKYVNAFLIHWDGVSYDLCVITTHFVQVCPRVLKLLQTHSLKIRKIVQYFFYQLVQTFSNFNRISPVSRGVRFFSLTFAFSCWTRQLLSGVLVCRHEGLGGSVD